MKTDVAVIGSGLAALAAARTVQQSGRRVVLVWPGLSSLYFVFATVDVLGYPTATAADPIDDPAKGLAQLIAKQPGHPYARAGMKAVEDGTSLMLEWFKDAGLAWEGSLNRNFLLPTATGAPKPSCLAPASMTAGDLRRPEPIVLGRSPRGPRIVRRPTSPHDEPAPGRAHARELPRVQVPVRRLTVVGDAHKNEQRQSAHSRPHESCVEMRAENQPFRAGHCGRI